MSLRDELAGALVANESAKRLWRYTKGPDALYLLAKEILHYDKLTDEFHKPICRWWMGNEAEPFQLLLAPRGHFKSTLQIADCVRCILIDPNATQLFLHAVEDEACKLVQEAGNHFIKNDDLRRLRPEIMPSKQAKKWLTNNQFTVKRPGYDRQPSVVGKAIMSEITGMHVNSTIRLDDIIGKNTIEDSQLPKVKDIFRHTIMPVRMPGSKVRATGTRWDLDDIYGMWIEDGGWQYQVRGAYEVNGVPDMKGTPVLLSPKELKLLEKSMGHMFPYQMQNDPSPVGDKVWDSGKCEHVVTLKEASGQGALVCLSDPAPAKTGNLLDEKKRDGMEKDDWATAIVKVRRRGDRREMILLDLKTSKEWDPRTGWKVMCQMMKKWKARYVAVEKTGQAVAFYEADIRLAARDAGIKYSPVDLTMTYSGKNAYFSSLASMAKDDEFLICAETIPAGELEKFLYQCRNWRVIGKKNNLKFDDSANCVSFGTDPEVMRLAPVAEDDPSEWSPFRVVEPEENYTHSTRHISW